MDGGFFLVHLFNLAYAGRKFTGIEYIGFAPALYRLYQATAQEHWVLDPSGHPDHRTPVYV